MFLEWGIPLENKRNIRKSRIILEELSGDLERISNGERLTASEGPGSISDTLPSKISHQLVRLSDRMYEVEQRAARDRDELKELISEIAHQLRNPLANMESYLELLSQSNLSAEEKASYLQAVCEAERSVRFLTESFIKMARLESRVIQIKKESFDLQETILNSVLKVGQMAEEKNIQVHLEMKGNIAAAHDGNWLKEALVNLLDNSIKYSKEGDMIQITVTQNEMFTEISVRDFGIGIEEGEENQIFKRFYRGRRVTVEEGFGIGLYLAREIVQHHGGFMKVKRQEPGLSASIFLPV